MDWDRNESVSPLGFQAVLTDDFASHFQSVCKGSCEGRQPPPRSNEGTRMRVQSHPNDKNERKLS